MLANPLAAVPAFRTRLVPTLLDVPDGRLVIARTPTAARPVRRYDLIDRQGRLTGTLTLDGLDRVLLGVGARYAYVLTTGEYDLQTLARHRLGG